MANQGNGETKAKVDTREEWRQEPRSVAQLLRSLAESSSAAQLERDLELPHGSLRHVLISTGRSFSRGNTARLMKFLGVPYIAAHRLHEPIATLVQEEDAAIESPRLAADVE